jgi:hypothetical protein
MMRLYWYLLCVIVGILVITTGIFIDDIKWWQILIWSCVFLLTPYWIAETIKSIKLLKVKDDKNETKTT